MRVDITGRHVEVTPPLRKLIDQALGKLERVLNDRAVSATVTLTKEKYRHIAEIIVHARGDHTLTGVGQGNTWPLALRQAEAGSSLPHVIVEDDRIVGRITLNGIVRGPFQSAGLGYWVAEAANGRGLASAAVARIARLAVGEMSLHRIEAGTMAHNAASQRVLERNGFRRIGFAPRYLRIDGDWRDHVLFQLLAD